MFTNQEAVYRKCEVKLKNSYFISSFSNSDFLVKFEDLMSTIITYSEKKHF